MDPNAPALKPTFAWQPLTARGVAAFANSRLGRVFGVQFVFALAFASVFAWFLVQSWFPVIKTAIDNMPETGQIRGGRLDWHGPAPVLLAENAFLAIAVDPDHTGRVRSPSVIYVEFGRTDARIFALFGYVPQPYSRNWGIDFNHVRLKPWWGAWAPMIIAIAVGATIAGLMTIWAILAAFYSGPVWLLAYCLDRECSLQQAWKIAAVSLLPGTLFLAVVLVLHGLGILDVIRVLIAWGAHLLVAPAYLWMAPLRLPKATDPTLQKVNPFLSEPKPAGIASVNPFAAASMKAASEAPPLAPENPPARSDDKSFPA